VAVTLRLTRVGVRGHPHYRIVAAEKERPRDGKFIEVVGTYVPVNPPRVTLNEEKVKRWLQNGARVSNVIRDILIKNLPGVIEAREKHQHEKVLAARKSRKARAKGGKKASKKK
jgi:small subunit ribosomal protein S16